MTQFTFTSMVTVSARTVVEADSLDEARAIAEERGYVALVGFGADEYDAWLIEDADGEPTDIEQVR